MLGKAELVLVCLFGFGNGRQIHSEQTPASSWPVLQKKQPLAALLLKLAPTVSPCHSPSRRNALVHDTTLLKPARRQSGGVKLAITEPSEDVVKTVNWFEGLLQKLQGNGRAAFASLVAETVVFWIVFLIPAAVFIYHQNTGIWMPDRSDPEAWASFMSIIGGCYMFCKIPPIEAARWAWVFAWTPWFQENFFSNEAEAEAEIKPQS
jgi:hypothetical protein